MNANVDPSILGLILYRHWKNTENSLEVDSSKA